jgi:uncharacterized protein
VLVLFLAAVWAGVQNALAGGGTFLTLPALMATGIDARSANIVSSLALFPGQVNTGWLGREDVRGVGDLSFGRIALVSLLGGLVGAVLLLLTPSAFFAALVPWLVLVATGLFALGSFRKPTGTVMHLSPRMALVAQFCIATYGGYFGGGMGFLMLAVLTAAGLSVRHAGATKNALAALLNASAVAVLAFTPGVSWGRVVVVAVGALLGGYLGVLCMRRVNERALRVGIVILGLCLTVGLFLRAHSPGFR